MEGVECGMWIVVCMVRRAGGRRELRERGIGILFEAFETAVLARSIDKGIFDDCAAMSPPAFVPWLLPTAICPSRGWDYRDVS